jgi:glycosyltransferase involved in cell wall biosynthesis
VTRRDDLTPCLIFPSLTVQAGGLTNAVRRRANFYAQHFAKVLVLTTEFQPDYPSVIAEMTAEGQLADGVEVRNFYYDSALLQDAAPARTAEDEDRHGDGLVEVVEDTPAGSPDEVARRYFTPEGRPVKVERFRDGRLHHVDHLDAAMRRVTRDEYLEDGRLVRRRAFSLTTNQPQLATYFTAGGAPVATAKLHPRSGVPGRTFAFLPEAEDLASFTTLLARWIDEEIGGLPRPVLFSDQRGKSDPVLLGASRAARRIAVLHNNHFIDPNDSTSGVRDIFANLFDRADEVDQIVVLTEEQLADLREDFPTLPFLHIGHAAPAPRPVEPGTTKDPNLVVMVAQLIERKQVDHAVRAFADVVRRFPEARLEVYGEGGEYEPLQALIEELGLGASVQLMGYSLQVATAQQRAVCQLLTSTFEGSPLVLGESLANGTPVVSYDIKYGPRDWIRDGIDGLLVTDHQPAALAEAIMTMLGDPELAARMAERARDVAERCSIAEYEKKWLDVLE